jgi:hypothetical protein
MAKKKIAVLPPPNPSGWEWPRHVGVFVMGLVANVIAPFISPFWGAPLSAIGIALLLYSIPAIERWVNCRFQAKPAISGFVFFLLLCGFTTATAFGWKLWRKHSAVPPVPVTANLCPNGYTVIENVEASKSSWDTANTTGFYFDGPNPCVILKGAKSTDNNTGYKFSNRTENLTQTEGKK